MTFRIFSTARPWAPWWSCRPSRARLRWSDSCAVRNARLRSSACWAAETTMSFASRRLARPPRVWPPSRPTRRCRSLGSAPSRRVPDSSSVTRAACRCRIAAGLRSFRVTLGPQTLRQSPSLHRLRRARNHRGEALHRRLVLHPLPELPPPAPCRSPAWAALDAADGVPADRGGSDRGRRGNRVHAGVRRWGALACALLYVWEFLLTRRSPLEVVTLEEAREYRRNWIMTSIATICATGALVYLTTQM